MKSVHVATATLLLALLGGCAEPEPAPEPPPKPVYITPVFDRAWAAALGGAQDAGVQIQSSDRATGLIRGTKDGIDVTVVVARQADGSVRVHFSSKGPKENDPGLADRFSKAYDKRMGR
jgi:hypothetical protein